MIKCEFMLVAQKAVIERKTNLVSVINVVQGIEAVSFPFVAPPLAIVLRTKRDVNSDPEKVEFLLQIRQGRNLLFKNNVPVDYEGKDSNNLVVTIGGLLVQEPSALKVRYKYGTRKLKETEIKVVSITPQIEKKK